jgi:tRNA threonylcarbamoyladenosine biosynthesis protein TsaE
VNRSLGRQVLGSWLSATTSTVIESRSEHDTIEAGRALGASLEAGDVILLHGELGSGKTAFVRGIAAGLGLDPADVTSPTFTIVQEYRGTPTLQHVDLYRLSPREVTDLTLEDLTDGNTVLAIEWAERVPYPLRPPLIEVRLEETPGGRRISIDRRP